MTTHIITNNLGLQNLVTADNDTVLFATNTTFDARLIPANIIKVNNLTIGEYGTGSRPIFDGGVEYTGASLTLEPTSGNTWYKSFAHEDYGNVTEDGEPLSFVSWKAGYSNKVTMSSEMPVGSFTNDYANNTIYIKPNGGTPVGKMYKCSEAYSGMINLTTPVSNLTIKNIGYSNISVAACSLLNTTNALIENITGDMIGGAWSTASSFFFGDFITIGTGSSNIIVKDNSVVNEFDGAYTAQTFSSGGNISDIQFLNNYASKCGMFGVSIALANSALNQTIKNVVVDGLVATNIGKNCWSGNRGGHVIDSAVTAPLDKSKFMENIVFKNISGSNAIRLIRKGGSYSKEVFLNIYGVDVDTLVQDYGDGNNPCVLYYNVTDDLARTPSGTTGWQLTTGLAQPIRTTLKR